MTNEILGTGELELSVDVTVNGDCSQADYPVLLTFGTRSGGKENCNGQRNATEVILPSEDTVSPGETEVTLSPGETVTFSIPTMSVSLGPGEEYCYIVSLDEVPGKY